MKRILLISFLLATSLLWSMGLPQNFQSSIVPNTQSNKLKDAERINNELKMTKAQYVEMLSLLKNAYKMGDKGKSYIIASAYLQKHILLDGIIEPNVDTAIRWFKRALANGYGLSALNIAFLYDLKRNDVYTALNRLEQGINSKVIDTNGKVVIAMAYGSIVLEKIPGRIKYVRKAIDLIYPVVNKSNIASMDYIFANLLNLNNQPKLANKFLNSACNNPNVPSKIKFMCMNGPDIRVVNKNGRAVKPRCIQKQIMPELIDQ